MAENKVFLDTSALVAFLRERDSCHKKAQKTWQNLRQESTTLVISEYIFAEFVTVIRQKLGIKVAIEAGKFIKEGKIFEKVWLDRYLEEKAWIIFCKTKIKDISFIDCLSLVCMKELGIKTIFTFDKHFKELGCQVLN